MTKTKRTYAAKPETAAELRRTYGRAKELKLRHFQTIRRTIRLMGQAYYDENESVALELRYVCREAEQRANEVDLSRYEPELMDFCMAANEGFRTYINPGVLKTQLLRKIDFLRASWDWFSFHLNQAKSCLELKPH